MAPETHEELTPEQIAVVNKMAAAGKLLANATVNQDTSTLGWIDLGFIWLFELGESADIKFDGDDATTLDLKGHVGVKEARYMALELLAATKLAGETSKTGNTPWDFNVPEAVDTITQGDLVAAFLGSYNVTYTWTCAQDTGKWSAELVVKNESGWESATRYRRAATEGGKHQGIIMDRERGEEGGIQLGGTLKQEWTWTEDEQTVIDNASAVAPK